MRRMKTFWPHYRKTRAILDCTEFAVEKPKRPSVQRKTWSRYKSRNTAKLLIATTPRGTFSFVSKLWSGNTSDQELVILTSHHSNSTWLFMHINLQLQTSDVADCWFGLWSLPWLQRILGYLRIRRSHGSDHSPNLLFATSEVCNCKLIRINNQVLLDDGNRIIIAQGKFKVLVLIFNGHTRILVCMLNQVSSSKYQTNFCLPQ